MRAVSLADAEKQCDTVKRRFAGRKRWRACDKEDAMTARIRVGTASWTDHEPFYPAEYARAGMKSQRISYYARYFSLVEVDSTFYTLQPARNFQLWADRTPDGFIFDVKAFATERLANSHSRAAVAVSGEVAAVVEQVEHQRLTVIVQARPAVGDHAIAQGKDPLGHAQIRFVNQV